MLAPATSRPVLGRLILLATAVAILTAGCVAPAANLDPANAPGVAGDLAGSARLPPPGVDLSGAIVSDHGAPYMHAIPQLHTGSYRMELVGYDPLTRPLAGDDPLVQNSAWAAVTLFQDKYACISHFAGTGGVGGATIVDISDPAAPHVISSIPDLAIGSRCLFTDDGKFLLAGSYGGLTMGVPALGPYGSAAANGVSIYDMSDPAHPRFVTHDRTGIEGDVKELDGSYHNLATVNVNGTNYVFQTYNGKVLKLADDGSSMEVVAQLEHSNHDFWVGRHPITNELLLVTGAGNGTAFFNIDEPQFPVLLGVWETTLEYAGWHRQWPLEQTVGGRAIMIVAGEECGNGKSLPYTVLDFTDMENVAELGHWQVPGKPEITEPGQLCSMNSHEFNTWNGYVATGNYHAGVWVFDVGSPERLVEPVTIGYYEPHEEPRLHGGTRNTPFAWSPDVWGAYFDSRGYVYAADWYTGFYVLKVPGATPE